MSIDRVMKLGKIRLRTCDELEYHLLATETQELTCIRCNKVLNSGDRILLYNGRVAIIE